MLCYTCQKWLNKISKVKQNRCNDIPCSIPTQMGIRMEKDAHSPRMANAFRLPSAEQVIDVNSRRVSPFLTWSILPTDST